MGTGVAVGRGEERAGLGERRRRGEETMKVRRGRVDVERGTV